MPDPISLSSDAELRALTERALTDKYELDREIGRGGMGIVYRARDRRLKRTVAVKVLPPELAYRSEIRSRFLREAETAAQLNHPDIVPIYSVDEREGLVFFVMACIEGETLAKRLHDQGRLPIDDARRILREVADALAYAHARGVIHRDIKPDNILLDGESGRAMVTDFGIARAVQEGTDASRLTATGVAIGTPAFMSPEQAAGDKEIDGRSDIYSLGVVAFQMLTGRLPFQASNTPAMLMKHITERPPDVRQLRPDVPADLAAAVTKMLEKEPADRFSNAAELAQALDDSAPVGSTATRRASTGTHTFAGRVPTSPVPSAPPPAPVSGTEHAPPRRYATPSPDDIARWSAPEVQQLRRRIGQFLFVNIFIVLLAIVNGPNFLTFSVLWGMWLAYKYSQLWSAGYDWRDIFRQPRDRRLLDIAHETIEEARSTFGAPPTGVGRGRGLSRRGGAPALPPVSPRPYAAELASPAVGFGAHEDVVRQAERDRGEILQLVDALPRGDQALVDGVIPAAEALLQRVRSLAASLAAQERAAAPGARERLEKEIADLEAQANPLDVSASETRVRRLALLKRERRALADTEERRADTAAKLESCRIALQNMRYDILRLRAGEVSGNTQHITQLTERARELAEDVDAVAGVAEPAGRRERRRS